MDITSSLSEDIKTKSYTIPELRWDTERNEPYCEVEIEGQRYLMTMWRESDGDDMVSHSCISVVDLESGS
jgi:hypothetical protein